MIYTEPFPQLCLVCVAYGTLTTQTRPRTLYHNRHVGDSSVPELENIIICEQCSNPVLFVLMTMLINPNYLEAYLSSEKEHLNSA